MRAVFVLLTFFLASCELPFFKAADRQFGDQHFKTAVALIELHRIRTGEYPETLQDLKFVGDWDRIALQRVDYEKTRTGYRLEVRIGHTGKPELAYPPEFWQGLGIEGSRYGQVPGN